MPQTNTKKETAKKESTKASQNGQPFNKEMYLNWYEMMLRIRRFEEKAGQLYGMQKIRGFCHLYIGQEAVAAGTITALKKEDPMITAYRDHGLAIGRGMSCDAAMAELYGKSTGCSKGKGGSMHFFDKENYFFGGHGIVGAQIGTGAGLAFAEKYKETGNVCVCFFGDGAVRQGMVHEIFNLAMLWSLPVIFICENNYYAMGTSVKRSSNLETIAHLGEAYGMPNAVVDGMRCEDVYNAVAKAAEHARQGNGPTFLEIQTYRYKGHSMSDPQKYRTKDELEEYKLKDPIETTLKTIYDKKYASEAEIEAINEKIKTEVDACVEFAENSPYPDASEMYTDNYMQKDYPFIMD